MNDLLERIYEASPWYVQNLFVTGYGIMLNRREYGKEFREKLAEFNERQWNSPEELREYQDAQLRKLITHCYDNVQYYRRIMDERGLKPSDIESVSDLPKLPVLTREDIREHFEALTASNVNKNDLVMGHTSGTTGSPLEFYYDRRVCLMKNVVDWRQKAVAGITFGDRIAYFLGRIVVPISQTKPPFWRHNFAANHLFFSSFHLSSDNIRHYVRKLREFKPHAVEGYPSTLSIIARFLESRGETIPIKAVFSSSETLFPQQREVIESAFGAKLFDYYGLAERTVFATECEQHTGHHINSDFGIVELIGVNSKEANPGELGRIVSTGLHNFAMPLIRYRTSDVTSITSASCPCGRGFPVMADVTTKEEDVITTKDGRLISSSILTHPFKPMKNVSESQIVQENRDTIRIKIVRRAGYDDSDTEYLINEIGMRIGREMNIHIEFVDEIERTAAGKFRWVVSKVPLEF